MSRPDYRTKAIRRLVEGFEELDEKAQSEVLDTIKYNGALKAIEEAGKTKTLTFGDLYKEAEERQKFFNKFEGFGCGLQYFDDAIMGFRPGEVTIIAGPSNFGKQQRVSEIIPTPQGDRKFGSLKVGDQVFGSNGKPTTITGTFPQGVQDIYRVNFTDGSYLDTGKEHLWTLQRNGYKDRVVSSEQMLQKKPSETYHIPTTSIQFEDKELSVDPYLIGMYIADGSQGKFITKKAGVDSDYIGSLDKTFKRNDYDTSVGRWWFPASSSLGKYVRTCGLSSVKSREKFIPNELFQKHSSVRFRLLQGLMDGDGKVGVGTDKVPIYSTTSERLADDVVRLVTSLGYLARKSFVKHPVCGWFTVRINGLDVNPFLVSWNRDRFSVSPRRKHRSVKSVEIVGKEEAMCISVEAKDQLYVGDVRFHIVTHNTTVALNVLVATVINSLKKGLIISLEMTAEEIASRVYNIADDHTNILKDIVIQTDLRVNANNIQHIIERENPDIVMIDLLQKLADRERGSEYERVSAAMAKVKEIALKTMKPIMLISHVAKTRSGSDGQATASDLKGASNIEQDTDVGIMLNKLDKGSNDIVVTNFKHRTKRPDVFHLDAVIKMNGIKVADDGKWEAYDG